MIKGFKDYETTEVKEYGQRAEKVELGGHICKIYEVKVETYKKSTDGSEFQMLVLKIDFEAPDEQAGFYSKRYVEDGKADALKAKWKGWHRVTIADDNSPEYIKTLFKTFITSIEKSNPGYKWAWDETTLVGKVFGGVFGLEEFTITQGARTGNTAASAKLRFVRSVEGIKDVEIPRVKLLNGEFMDYEAYVQAKKNENNVVNNVVNEFANAGIDVEITESDDLPF